MKYSQGEGAFVFYVVFWGVSQKDPNPLYYTKSGLIDPRSRISSAIVAGTLVPPTSGALYIFLWKMPTEVSHNIHLLLLVSVT
eukprot:SAG11_NODE_19120_length_473_cov_6.622995_1_plen_82_part_01